MVCSKEREHVPLLGGQVDLIDDTVVVKRLRYDTVVAVNTLGNCQFVGKIQSHLNTAKIVKVFMNDINVKKIVFKNYLSLFFCLMGFEDS